MRVAIDPGSVQVSPGGKVSAVLGVRNTGPVADTFLLSVDGIAADWFALGVTSLTLGPGAEETTSLVIQPPPGEKTPAGTYTATVQLTSEEDPSRRTSAPLTVKVLSAGSVTMALSPLQAQGRKAFFKATFTNHSNADASMTLTADDDENALTFKMRPDDTIDVPTGESATITVRVRPEIRRLVGQPRAFTFSLTGAYENDPFPTKIDAALTARARFTYIPRAQSLSLPNWLWYPLQLIFKLLLILAVLAFLFFLLDAIATGGKPKARPQPTEVAELQQTILAATKTPGNGKAAATAGMQLTAIAQGTTVLLAAVPEEIGSITATATITGTGKSGSKGAVAKNTKAPAAPTPNITQFTLIPSGSYVAATWQVDGATEVELNGQVVPSNGAIAVPAGAAVALLQAFNGKSVAQQALPVPTTSVPAAADSGAAAGGTTGGAAAGGAAGGDTSAGSGATGAAGGSTDAAGGTGGTAGGTLDTVTPIPTATPLPTSTAYPTSTPLPTQLPTSTLPPTATPTAAIVPPTPPPPTATTVDTATAIPPTATASATAVSTDTATSAPTATDTETATTTPSPTPSPSYTASPTATATDTATAIPPTATDTATETATATPSATDTATETVTIALIPTVTVITTEPITGTDTITTTDVLTGTTTSSLAAAPEAPAPDAPAAETATLPALDPTATNTPTAAT